MNEETKINYLILYLKKKYCISEQLQEFLVKENFTSPFALKYIDLDSNTFSEGDRGIITLLTELSNEEYKKIKNNIILKYRLYYFDDEKINLPIYLENKYLISTCLKTYLIENNYTCAHTLGYINDDNFKQGDKNFLSYFNHLENSCFDIINQRINIINNKKKNIFKFFKNNKHNHEFQSMFMDIDD